MYAIKGAAGVSWYQEDHGDCLQWIEALAPDRTSALIDVGAGASTLVDGLLKRGYRTITLLDQSELALALTLSRLQSDLVLARLSVSLHWLHGELLNAVLPYRGLSSGMIALCFTSSPQSLN